MLRAASLSPRTAADPDSDELGKPGFEPVRANIRFVAVSFLLEPPFLHFEDCIPVQAGSSI